MIRCIRPASFGVNDCRQNEGLKLGRLSSEDTARSDLIFDTPEREGDRC